MAARFTAIIFDLDGTLVDSYGPIAQSLNQVRLRFGFPEKGLDEVRREVGRGLEALIADNVGAERTAEGVRIFRSHYRKVFLSGTKLLAGVAPTLALLHGRGVPMVVASNKPAYFTREIVEELGIGSYLRAILGPEMVARPKPDPEMVLEAVEILGRPRNEVLYAGDMTIDVETCRRAGVAVCVIPGGSDTLATLREAEPDFLLERFEEIPALMAGTAG